MIAVNHLSQIVYSIFHFTYLTELFDLILHYVPENKSHLTESTVKSHWCTNHIFSANKNVFKYSPIKQKTLCSMNIQNVWFFKMFFIEYMNIKGTFHYIILQTLRKCYFGMFSELSLKKKNIKGTAN